MASEEQFRGRLVNGSIAERLVMKLDRASDTESIGIGSYITLPCRAAFYICKVSDVGYAQLDLHETIVSTKLQELREKNVVIEPFRRKVTESPFFYSVTLKPLKMIKDSEVLEPQYLPNIFTTGRFTTCLLYTSDAADE